MPTQASRTLETFANPTPSRDFRIHMEIPEFTCLCPKTGQPDFATLILDYVPDRRCVELMERFIREHPDLWDEDIGVPPTPEGGGLV